VDRLPLLTASEASFVEDFAAGALDGSRWVAHYLPHWSTPERSRARCGFGADGLELRIEADQPDWRPEDAPLRVSNLQTATFSGPVGSTRGTHRHRPDGLTVRTATPTRLLWAPREGQVDVRVTASRDRGCMLAVWLVGTEHESPEDSGEVCVCEIDADAVGATSTRVRTGVKAHHDPRLRTEVTEVEVPVGAGRAHWWSARWGPSGVVVACDERVVFTSAQHVRGPQQLMVDLFETVPPGPAGEYPKTAAVHAVRAS
jgi:Glycosyl hydrolases family 16